MAATSQTLAEETVQSPNRSALWLPAIVSISGVFLYLQVFALPFTPSFAGGDAAIYLHHATRLLHGELIYRDYDHFTFPGTDVLYMALFRVFGVRMWIPDAMLVLLGMCLVWLVTSVSRKVLNGPIAVLPALLFVCLPYSSYLDATHHWYSAVGVTAALALLLQQRSLRKLIWVGVLLGLATFFTQSMVLVAIGFASYLIWERKHDQLPGSLLLKQEAALLGSFLGTTSACIAYFIAKAGLKRFLYFTVVFVVKYYPADWFNNWRVYLTGRPHLHDSSSWIDIPAFGLMHLIVPYIYVFFAVWLARHVLPGELRKRLILINVTGISLFLTVASAPADTRLYVVSAPALILTVWLLHSWSRGRRWVLSLWVTVMFMAVVRPLFTEIRHKNYLDLAVGHTVFFGDSLLFRDSLVYEKCEWMSRHSHPGDYYFGDHLVAFALGLHNVSRVPFLRPTDYTRPEEVADAIANLEKFQVKYVAWYSGLNTETEIHEHPEGDHLDPMWDYLHQHYRAVVTFANQDQIWERDR